MPLQNEANFVRGSMARLPRSPHQVVVHDDSARPARGWPLHLLVEPACGLTVPVVPVVLFERDALPDGLPARVLLPVVPLVPLLPAPVLEVDWPDILAEPDLLAAPPPICAMAARAERALMIATRIDRK
jgi:hypothetical protein